MRRLSPICQLYLLDLVLAGTEEKTNAGLLVSGT